MTSLIEWRELPQEQDSLTRAPIRRWRGLLVGVTLCELCAPNRHNPNWRAFMIALGDDRSHFDRETEGEAREAAESWVQEWLGRVDALRCANGLG